MIINAEGITVKCDQPVFKGFTCFDHDNIAELKTAIDKVNMSDKDRKNIRKLFRRVKSMRGLK